MRNTLIAILYLFLSSTLFSQHQSNLVFYNVENLFDNEVDSSRSYKEFNPEEAKNWNSFRYYSKINQLAKVLAACADSLPEFIALAEIENKKVLEDLIAHPLLFHSHYDIIHFESDDVRGIDVAFLYQRKVFDLLAFKKLKIKLRRPTRDILFVKGVHVKSGDTLSFFVNHWPSRYGGKKKSDSSRIAAAKTLKNAMDSLQKLSKNENFIACGDFNDTPVDSSLQLLSSNEAFINLCLNNSILTSKYKGTIKYKRQWQCFDQFIVSKNLLEQLHLQVQSVKIYSPDWLLEKDFKYGGMKPLRTFIGPKYHGGISDHLPIVLTLKYY